MHILYIRNVNIRRSRYIIYLYRVYTIYSTHSTNERATICVTTILIEFRINTNLWMRRYSNIEWNIPSTRIILRWNFTLHFSIFCRHREPIISLSLVHRSANIMKGISSTDFGYSLNESHGRKKCAQQMNYWFRGRVDVHANMPYTHIASKHTDLDVMCWSTGMYVYCIYERIYRQFLMIASCAHPKLIAQHVYLQLMTHVRLSKYVFVRARATQIIDTHRYSIVSAFVRGYNLCAKFILFHTISSNRKELSRA